MFTNTNLRLFLVFRNTNLQSKKRQPLRITPKQLSLKLNLPSVFQELKRLVHQFVHNRIVLNYWNFLAEILYKFLNER